MRRSTLWLFGAVALPVVGALVVCAASADGHESPKTASPPPPKARFLPGYLPAKSLPDSLALLPPPPAPHSAAFARDEEIARQSAALRDTPRWRLATQDANLDLPKTMGDFSCAMGAEVTEKDTPRLFVLLKRSFVDAGLSTYAAKNHYARVRPFVVENRTSCTPDEEAILRKDGSYPSGHSAAGWAWALILAELSPDQSNAILARGRAFGQSRVVCNVHWQSDVDEGRTIGAAAVARLHGDPVFRADLDAARSELAAARLRGVSPTRDCRAEAAALAR